MYKLCRKVLLKEEIPVDFYNTMLIQLYKGKGCTQELSNSRFLHIKQWLPRLCEGLLVAHMREGILETTSKFQIGGKPRMRTQFHLFVLNSIIARCKQSDDGRILTADLVKFFDKELLSGAVVSLREDVDQKALRLWSKLNSRTTIRVKTGVGLTEEGRPERCWGRGAVGAH